MKFAKGLPKEFSKYYFEEEPKKMAVIIPKESSEGISEKLLKLQKAFPKGLLNKFQWRLQIRKKKLAVGILEETIAAITEKMTNKLMNCLVTNKLKVPTI